MLQSFRERFFKRTIKIHILQEQFLCQSCPTISIPDFHLHNTFMDISKTALIDQTVDWIWCDSGRVWLRLSEIKGPWSWAVYRTKRPGRLAGLPFWMLKSCWVWWLIGEFNAEPDVLKYQIMLSVLQRIKIRFWVRKSIDSFFWWPGKASLRRWQFWSYPNDKTMSGENNPSRGNS